ncbi:MAG: hydrogenase expression protein HupH [Hyphomicrobiales bacterium]|nr:hydrogenase expression protein HupH [Hyphomicrobiales bacterium]
MGVHVRVVTPITSRGFRLPEHFDGVLGPQDTVSHVEIDRGPASIECEFDEMLSVPDTVRRIIEAERDGVDAVVIDCMGDPGLKAGRECVTIPVLGPCETSMNLACMLGNNYSVITVLERLRGQFENQAKVFGAWEKFASVRAVDIPVLELEGDPEGTRQTLTEQALLAVEKDGADVIIFGCTGMMGCAEAVQAGLLKDGYEVPVIDPVPATIRVAAALVASGLSHSKRAYELPPNKPVTGYDIPPLHGYKSAAE